MRKLIIAALAICLLGIPVFAGMETEYGTSAVGVTTVKFSPYPRGVLTVKAGSIRHDFRGTVKFYAKGGAGRETPTAYPTNGATVIAIDNADGGFAGTDKVIYYHKTLDTTDYRTVSSATTTNITLSSGVSAAGAAGDQVYEITQQGQMDVVSTGATVTVVSENIFVTPSDSPLYIAADISAGTGSTTNLTLNITVEQSR